MNAHDDAPSAKAAFDETMRALIAERWRDVWKAMPDRRNLADPEAIHKVRVASRRLRAAMDTATDVFPKRWYRRLHREARHITHEFGTLRDADVMLETLRTERKIAPEAERAGLDDLIARQEHIRGKALIEVRRYCARIRKRHLRRETRKCFPRQPQSRRKVLQAPHAGTDGGAA
ncbi:MAG: CHAD domain-containing protein [Thermomicrobiales bacterium]